MADASVLRWMSGSTWIYRIRNECIHEKPEPVQLAPIDDKMRDRGRCGAMINECTCVV